MTVMKIKKGECSLEAVFESDLDAKEIYVKLFDALIDGGGEFELALEVVR
jgi:hypothetical protein